MSLGRLFQGFISAHLRLANCINQVVSHPYGFISAFYVSLVWVPFVVLGYDPHGFLYLYVATVVSAITNFNLGMIGKVMLKAEEERKARDALILTNISDNTKLLVLAVQTIIANQEKEGKRIEDIQEGIEGRVERAE